MRQFTVEGLSIRSAGPVVDTYLPLGDGLHVLYGRNGAGKTSIVTGLTSALSGVTSDCAAIVSGGIPRSILEAELGLSTIGDASDEETAHALARRLSGEGLGGHLDSEQEFEEIARAMVETNTFAVGGHGLTPLVHESCPVEAVQAHVAVLAHQARTIPDEWLGGHVGDEDPALWEFWQGMTSELGEVPGGWLAGAKTRTDVCSGTVPFDSSLLRSRVLTDADLVDDPTPNTRAYLAPWVRLRAGEARSAGGPFLAIRGDGEGLSAELEELVADFEQHVQALYDSLLLEAPKLHLKRHMPREWLTRGLLGWTVGETGLDLASLSRAERRWAHLAIRLGQFTYANRPICVVLDEPEAALHRTAEEHMARGLAQLARRPQATVLVATHSPALLDDPDAHLHEVRRADGDAATLVAVDSVSLEQASLLGLTPSDLLRRTRAFLLVEGKHDEIVLTKLLGDELRRLRVDILPLHGGKKLEGAADSRFLFDFTDAHIVALLDNIADASRVQLAWDDAYNRAVITGDVPAAIKSLHRALPGRKAAEYLYLRNFLARALERGIGDRVHPLGLSLPDVIMYLPESTLVPRSPLSWAELHEKYSRWLDEDSQVQQKKKHGALPDFKKWLAFQYGATIDEHTVAEAAAAMDSIPEEFSDLLQGLQDLWE